MSGKISQNTVVHFLLLAMILSSALCLEFVVLPTDQTIAPNANASFHCAVRGSNVYVKWAIGTNTYSKNDAMPRGYTSIWNNSTINNSISTTLIIDSRHTKNGTSVRCNAGNSTTHSRSNTAHLNIAAKPMIPFGVVAGYDRDSTAVNVNWSEPFTYLPQFPILHYLAEIEYLTHDHDIFKRDRMVIKGVDTTFSLALNETELCSSKQICISLRAVNEIGYSKETETTCANIERDHAPLPVNASVSKHPDGRTLVSALYQVPSCFPHTMQSSVVVEEVTSYNSNELTSELLPLEEGGYLMEAHAITLMKQDVVYSVVVQLNSLSENTTSLPVYVTLPAEATTGSNDPGNGAITGIVVAVLLAVFLVTFLIIALLIFVYFHNRNKDVTAVNHMQSNPLYENTFYDSIPDGYSLSPVRSNSYDSHIYQDMPELIRRLHNNGHHPPSSLPLNNGQTCLDMESPSLEQMKRAQTVVAEAVGGSESTVTEPPETEPVNMETEPVNTETERESEYITMHSVTEQPASVLQTDV